MTLPIPSSEPESLIAGDTWRWTKSVPDFMPGTGYTLGYSIRGISKLADADVIVTPSGSVYSVIVASDKTTPLLPGTYRWIAFVTNIGGDRFIVDRGILTVELNLTTADAGDAEFPAERNLRVLEAVLAGRITADIEQYQIAGRQVTKIPISELETLHAKYRQQVWRLRHGHRLGPVLQSTFARPR